MKCFKNILVVLFVFNFLKISNGLKWKGNGGQTDQASEEITKIDYRELYSTIPEAERADFIKIHLAIALSNYEDPIDLPDGVGVDQDTYNVIMARADLNAPKEELDLESIPEIDGYEFPEEFSNDLLTWTQEEFNLTKNDVYRMVVYSQICFPSGCVNPGDIGGHCCPF